MRKMLHVVMDENCLRWVSNFGRGLRYFSKWEFSAGWQTLKEKEFVGDNFRCVVKGQKEGTNIFLWILNWYGSDYLCGVKIFLLYNGRGEYIELKIRYIHMIHHFCLCVGSHVRRGRATHMGEGGDVYMNTSSQPSSGSIVRAIVTGPD